MVVKKIGGRKQTDRRRSTRDKITGKAPGGKKTAFLLVHSQKTRFLLKGYFDREDQTVRDPEPKGEEKGSSGGEREDSSNLVALKGRCKPFRRRKKKSRHGKCVLGEL